MSRLGRVLPWLDLSCRVSAVARKTLKSPRKVQESARALVGCELWFPCGSVAAPEFASWPKASGIPAPAVRIPSYWANRARSWQRGFLNRFTPRRYALVRCWRCMVASSWSRGRESCGRRAHLTTDCVHMRRPVSGRAGRMRRAFPRGTRVPRGLAFPEAAIGLLHHAAGFSCCTPARCAVASSHAPAQPQASPDDLHHLGMGGCLSRTHWRLAENSVWSYSTQPGTELERRERAPLQWGTGTAWQFQSGPTPSRAPWRAKQGPAAAAH